MPEAARLVEVRRGGVAEAVHRGHVAIVDASGALVASRGDPDYVTFMRSAAKPLQAVPVVESGAADRFGLEERHLAVVAASHNGEPVHVAAVSEVLQRVGLSAEALRCGVHQPWSESVREALCREGQKPSPLHNNCSGKHAGMLMLAVHLGWATEGYTAANHPVQGVMASVVADICGLEAQRLTLASDGCTVPTFAMALRNMALGFARLASAVSGRGETAATARGEAMARVARAMARHPEMVAGAKRFDTALMSVAGGRIIAKSGAEGVLCVAIPEKGWGVALKVEDGAGRAAPVAMMRVLSSAGLISDREAAALDEYAHPPVTNRRGERVGEMVAVF